MSLDPAEKLIAKKVRELLHPKLAWVGGEFDLDQACRAVAERFAMDRERVENIWHRAAEIEGGPDPWPSNMDLFSKHQIAILRFLKSERGEYVIFTPLHNHPLTQEFELRPGTDIMARFDGACCYIRSYGVFRFLPFSEHYL